MVGDSLGMDEALASLSKGYEQSLASKLGGGYMGWLLARNIKDCGPGKCWPWQGALQYGYGRGRATKAGGRKMFMAHRAVYENVNGRIEDPELVVMHACDNRACCNPEHLSLGTKKDNALDMVAKGRHRHAKGPIDNWSI